MKLKVLPPTLRKNNRYLAVDIKIASKITKDDLVGIIWDACVRFKGECGASNYNLWVMRVYEMDKCDDYSHYKAIVRCQREFAGEVRSCIALFNMFNGDRISMTTLGLSGTIKGCGKFI